jgi:hypothetical protein
MTKGAVGRATAGDTRNYAARGDADHLSPGGECLVAGGMKLRDGVLVGAAGENVSDLIMSGTCRGDLNRFMIRSRRRVGWREAGAYSAGG